MDSGHPSSNGVVEDTSQTTSARASRPKRISSKKDFVIEEEPMPDNGPLTPVRKCEPGLELSQQLQPKRARVFSIDDDDIHDIANGRRTEASSCIFENVLAEQLENLRRVLSAAHLQDSAARSDATKANSVSRARTDTTRDCTSTASDTPLADEETFPVTLDSDRSCSVGVTQEMPNSMADSTGPNGRPRPKDLDMGQESHVRQLSPHIVADTFTNAYSIESSSLELKSLWKTSPCHLELTTPNNRQLDRAVSGILKRTVTTHFVASGIDEYEDVRRSTSYIGRFMTHPTSIKRFFWDVLGVLIMLYDTVIIPMQVFELEASTITATMGKVSLGYWTFDILLSFMVGYYRRGVLEMRPMHIAAHYVATWFPFDFIICGLDWSVQIASGGDSESIGAKSKQVTRIGRALRTLRTLRSLRLLRLIKMKHLLSEIQERFSSEYVHIILRMVKLIVAIALLNHFIACGWWAIGNLGHQQSWITAGDFNDRAVGYCYTTSLHWSLTQFTPASMEVVPTNTSERTYAVCTLLFAMVIFSSFVSSITATMTILRELSGKQGKTKQFKVLRWYLKDNTVSKVLQIRILKYLQHVVLRAKSHVPEKEVELLSMLSQPLRMELRQTISWPVFAEHAFFHRFSLASTQATRQLCARALEEIPMSKGDSIFTTGEEARAMYFMSSGRCLYQQAQRGGLRSNADNSSFCEAGTAIAWLAELALWCNWVHKGELVANVQGRCMAVLTEPFSSVVAVHHVVVGSVRRYAVALLTEVERQIPVGPHPGDRVIAKLERTGEFYGAVVTFVNNDGTVDVEWDEEGIPRKTLQTYDVRKVEKNYHILSDLPADEIDLNDIAEESFPMPEINKCSSKRISPRDQEEMDLDWDLFQANLQGAERSLGAR